jgi:effector-binding domain-containing protein
MLSQPKLEQRAEQHYAAIRAQPTMRTIGPTAGPLLGELFGWLEGHGIAPAGPPFFRYLVIDMEGELQLDVGVPVENAISPEGSVIAGSLPAGEYATALHTGHYDGLADATAELLEWADRNGIVWDREQTPAGEAWGARVEHYLTNPDEEPDPARFETLLAFRTVSGPS